MTGQIWLPIDEASQVASARRRAEGMARALGFDSGAIGKAALIVTEMATNVLKHAGSGQLLLRPLEGLPGGLEMLSLDKGPGMANIAACLHDGYSSAGSPGTGLGAIRRLSEIFEIYTIPGGGTVLLGQLWPAPPKFPPGSLLVGSVSVPKPGEEVCGDNWWVEEHPRQSVILVVDGLGHGLRAEQASLEAVNAFRKHPGLSPTDLLIMLNATLRATRGAAVAVAEVNLAKQVVRFAGIGNIAATVYSAGDVRRMVSYPGTVGHEMRKVQEFSYPWMDGSILVLHTDGLSTRWNLDTYPGLRQRHPSVIAGMLYRDYVRGNDDVTVVVAKQSS